MIKDVVHGTDKQTLMYTVINIHCAIQLILQIVKSEKVIELHKKSQDGMKQTDKQDTCTRDSHYASTDRHHVKDCAKFFLVNDKKCHERLNRDYDKMYTDQSE